MFDTYDSLNSSGSCDFRYNTSTGVLTNPTSDVMTINLSGQLQTSNTAFDVTQYQPVISIVKNNNNIVSSSVLNYQGSSFSTVLVLNPNDQIIVTFKQYFSSPILIQAGQYTTRITYTQLNNIFSYTGYTG
jgi:formate/nitrite transporter FocA (FNT family)